MSVTHSVTVTVSYAVTSLAESDSESDSDCSWLRTMTKFSSQSLIRRLWERVSRRQSPRRQRSTAQWISDSIIESSQSEKSDWIEFEIETLKLQTQSQTSNSSQSQSVSARAVTA